MSADDSQLSITPLGAGCEVGRSCVVLRFKGKTVMLDCGIHPAHSGMAALPFFDEIDPATVDVVLVTHFHLDHAAALPYWIEKTTFRGRVFMTHPTKAIYKWLLADYVRVSGSTAEDGASAEDATQLYSEADLLRSYDKITAIDYHQEVDVDGVRFVALNAGHVLGAAMFMVEIAGVRVLYTGDYSREEDRHLMAAEVPATRPDVLVTESTYGVHTHQPRAEREARFTGLVHEVVARGGRCLIPVFALGRAQELLLILDEYWQTHPELHAVPVYYASSLARKCMSVYQTYVNMMNERIRRAAAVANPFVFRHVSYLRSLDAFADTGPCVMMASPAMLQSGLSRQLFEAWAPSPANGLIVPGYVVEGTLAKHILTEPKEFVSLAGATLPLRMTVEYISFSAHVDFAQNAGFIDELRPPQVVLVHGEAHEMLRLKAALLHRYGLSEKSCALPEAFLVGGAVGLVAEGNADAPEGAAGEAPSGPDASQAGAPSKGSSAATSPVTLPHTLADTATDQADNDAPSTSKTPERRVVNVHTPRNGESVELGYRGERVVKIVGSLGARMSAAVAAGTLDNMPLEGVLVGKDFEYQLVDPADLHEFVPGLRSVELRERQAVTCRAPFTLVEHLLVQLLGASAVKRTGPHDLQLLGGTVCVQSDGADAYVVEWPGNPLNDVVADSVVMLLLGAESSRLAVKATKHSAHDHGEDHKACGSHAESFRFAPKEDVRTELLHSYLSNTFGHVSVRGPDDMAFEVDGHSVVVRLSDGEPDVECDEQSITDRVRRVLRKIIPLLRPDYVL